MLNGLLVYNADNKKKVNIGDFMQSLASRQYLETIDVFVERESLSTYIPESGRTVNVIMNSWYMHRPENWPPTNYLRPCLVSMHITKRASEHMLNEKGIEYFKKYGTVGCRDYSTLQLLREKGIESYFSGCLTLTLGLKYKCEERTGEIIFVDPFIDPLTEGRKIRWKNVFCAIGTILKYPRTVCTLRRKFNYESFMGRYEKYFYGLEKTLYAALFYKDYKKLFTKELLLGATYITHDVKTENCPSPKQKLQLAESLLNKYAKAKMVITSRIHCALPCLGVETPVIFVTNKDIDGAGAKRRNSGRLDGLKELFRVLSYQDGEFTTDDPVLLSHEGLIDGSFRFINKDSHIPIRDNLVKTCQEFIGSSLKS